MLQVHIGSVLLYLCPPPSPSSPPPPPPLASLASSLISSSLATSSPHCLLVTGGPGSGKSLAAGQLLHCLLRGAKREVSRRSQAALAVLAPLISTFRPGSVRASQAVSAGVLPYRVILSCRPPSWSARCPRTTQCPGSASLSTSCSRGDWGEGREKGKICHTSASQGRAGGSR